MEDDFQKLIDSGKAVFHPGYKCPNCGKIDTMENAIKTTDRVFTGDLEEWYYEPGYEWLELYNCNCGTNYIVSNGT